jgi:small-conductance mechanosensitive channel
MTFNQVFRHVAICLAFSLTLLVGLNSTIAKNKEIPAAVPTPNTTGDKWSVEEVEIRIQDLDREIMMAVTSQNEQTAIEFGVTLRELQERNAKLRTARWSLEQLETALKKKPALQEAEKTLRQKLSSQEQKGLSQKPPYTLSFYDSMLDELTSAQQQTATLILAVRTAKKSLENLTTRLERATGQWRVLRDRVEAQPTSTLPGKLRWDLEKARIEKDYVESLFYLEKANAENYQIELQIAKMLEEKFRQQILWVRNHLVYDEADFLKQLNVLSIRKEMMAGRLQKLSKEKGPVEESWTAAQKNLEKAGQKNKGIAEAELKERESWRQTYQKVLEQTEAMLILLELQEDVLRNRYAIIKGETASENLSRWKEEADAHVENLDSIIGLQQNLQNNLQVQIVKLEKQLAEVDFGTQVKDAIENQLDSKRKLAERRSEYISVLLATVEMDRKLLEEISIKLKKMPMDQRISGIWDEIGNMWNFEIWAIDNRPVTVRKLIVSIFILVIGILIARYAVHMLTRRLVHYARLKETTGSAVQKMFTFLAYMLVFIFALRMVNIPLTAFAFLGGAIAIGVGFGAQNLINNFISGFIIMGERPISIGDLIEVEGVLGQVEDIGARSTRVRTGENIHILVPNSSFLEKNIINWTLSDKKLRTRVIVGVVYGSAVEKVNTLLVEATKGIKNVLNNPEPFVLFSDFGDNSLIFEVYFWISIRQTIERRMIESQVRFHIDELFREAGIVIAFPQRDVHLDTQQPLELRLIEMNGKSGKNENMEET